MTLRDEDYESSRMAPNIVVDGSPNESTVLTLAHWPGFEQPEGLARDLSAQMAFAYLDEPCERESADVVGVDRDQQLRSRPQQTTSEHGWQ